MRKYFFEPGCGICAYLMRAVYLANQHAGFNIILPVAITVDNIDRSTWIDFRRIFKDQRARIPTITVDKVAWYYEGIPHWRELYYMLFHFIRRGERR